MRLGQPVVWMLSGRDRSREKSQPSLRASLLQVVYSVRSEVLPVSRNYLHLFLQM